MLDEVFSFSQLEESIRVQTPYEPCLEVNIEDYVNPIFDSEGCIIQFTIPMSESEKNGPYAIRDNGLCISQEGISIINNSDRDEIFLISSNDVGIKLEGYVSIYNNMMDLVIVNTKGGIYCNGCSFPEIAKVIFYANTIQIGQKGLLSSGVNIVSVGRIEADGPVDIASLTAFSLTGIRFNAITADAISVLGGQEVLFNELYTTGSFQASAHKLQVLNKLRIGGNFTITTNLYIAPSVPANQHITGKVDITLTGSSAVSNINAEGELVITGDSNLNIGNILSESAISVKSNGKVEITGLVAANSAVSVEGLEIEVKDKVRSAGNIDLHSKGSIKVSGRVECGGDLNVILASIFSINNGGVVLSKGDAIVHATSGKERIDKVDISSASFIVAGDLLIKAAELNNNRSGEYRIQVQEIPGATGGNHADHKWSLSMNCYKEIFHHNTIGSPSYFLIGKSLVFEGSVIYNTLSRLESAGPIKYPIHTPTIHEQNIDLKISSNFRCYWAKGKYRGWCIGETKERLMRYCGLDSQGLTEGTVYRVYERLSSNIVENAHAVREEIEKMEFVSVIKASNPVETRRVMHNVKQPVFRELRSEGDDFVIIDSIHAKHHQYTF